MLNSFAETKRNLSFRFSCRCKFKLFLLHRHFLLVGDTFLILIQYINKISTLGCFILIYIKEDAVALAIATAVYSLRVDRTHNDAQETRYTFIRGKSDAEKGSGRPQHAYQLYHLPCLTAQAALLLLSYQ